MKDNGLYFMDDSCFENKNFKQELTDSNIESKLIKKAENWLREHLINDFDNEGSHIVRSKDSYFLLEFIEDFKQAIKTV